MHNHILLLIFFSYHLTQHSCSRNVRIVPDIPAPHSIPDHFLDKCSILILPGGGPGAATFCKDDAVLRLIREFRNEKKHVAFICAGTTALVASTESAFAGEVKDAAAQKCRVTSHPSVKQQIVEKGWEYAGDEERVVVDGKIITSRGPGTAILFALTIVEELLGKEERDEVQGPMVCADKL